MFGGNKIKGMNGIMLVEHSIGAFDSIRADLTQGIEQCEEGIKEHEAIIDTHRDHCSTLRDTVAKAKAVHQNIGKIIGE